MDLTSGLQFHQCLDQRRKLDQASGVTSLTDFWKFCHKNPCCPVGWSCWKTLSPTALHPLEAWVCVCTRLYCSCLLFCQKESQLKGVCAPLLSKGVQAKLGSSLFFLSKKKPPILSTKVVQKHRLENQYENQYFSGVFF